MAIPDEDKYQAGEPPTPAAPAAADCVVSPDTRHANRIPPGQSRTRKWPVLHASYVPEIDPAKWRLRIFGMVKNDLVLTWQDFQALPRAKVFADFHCVTRWSRLGNVWSGVSTRELFARAEPMAGARFAVAHGFDAGWTTNLPLADLLAEDALLADSHDGEPLTADHGGPLRLIVPQLYAWKSAKWLKAIELVADDRPGFWERNGYHLRGDPWDEQRFRDDA